MAKEEKIEGEAKEKEKEKEKGVKEGETPPNSGFKKKIIKLGIIGIGVLILSGGGFFGWRVFSKKGADDGSQHTSTASTEGEDKGGSKGHIVPLDSFVINLADSSDVRYLKITVNLEVDTEDVSEEAQERMPQIRDAILMLLSSKTSDDVRDTGGKIRLQDEMVTRVNNLLLTGKAKAVYFTEFVMQ